ncbi:hypothetical protein SpCBS45565_g00688 [Spizellomyces sp. 'palustris']|nr:hypothetical protein SpCBS45565_g00688 [Spizellomyces sp. 'palustris']
MAAPHCLSPKELLKQAEIKEPPNNYSFKAWINSALSLFDKGDLAAKTGEMEAAYVHFMKATTQKVSEYMVLMEQLKQQLQERHDKQRQALSSSLPTSNSLAMTPPSSQSLPNGNGSNGSGSIGNGLNGSGPSAQRSVVHPDRLLALLKQGSTSVLILDLRPMEEYILGHVKWKMRQDGVQGGVVHIEPDWLASDSLDAGDLENYLTSFGQSSALSKNLFEARHTFDLIVFLDQSSTSTLGSQYLRRLMQVIYNHDKKKPKQQPALLVGGFDGWDRFVKQSAENWGDWVEIGEGCGRFVVDENRGVNGVTGQVGLARSAYEYVRLVQSRAQQNASSGYSQKPLSSYPSGQLQQQQKTPQPSPPSSRRPSEPFQNRTNVQLNSATSAMPVIVPVTQSYHQAPLSQSSRFNDPFYNFQHHAKRTLDQSVYPSSLQTVGPRNESLAAYPAVGKNVSGTQSNNSFNYPSPITSVPTALSPRIPPPLPIKPRSNKDVDPSAPPPNIPPLGYHQIINTSPGFPRRPPPVAIAPPALTIRRSSSPSGSPSTARFYGLPPALPPKPRHQLQSSDTNSLQAFSRSTASELSYSQLGGFMGMAGLKNLGNTCFMNSVIQCLGGTVPLARYFLDGSYRKHMNRRNPLGTRGEVTDAFAELVKTMWSGQDGNVVTPTKFKEIIGAHHPSFRGTEQQDSQEFLAFLLDSLHEDLNVARKGTVVPDKEPDEDEEGIPDAVLLDRAWKRYRKLNWSIIVDLFQGILRNRLECLTCGKSSTTFNPFMYLTLPIPSHNQAGKKNGPVYLQECLDKFVEEEVLDGDDAWRCPRCKVPRRSTKRLTIARLPTVLLVHLKRFYFSGPFRNRVDTYVEFPVSSLDLTRYMTQRTGYAPEGVYDLYGISNHFGGLNGGHYTASVKNSYKNKWFSFDDSRFSGVDESSLRTPAAYLLFYVMNGRRTTDDWWSGGVARM